MKQEDRLESVFGRGLRRVRDEHGLKQGQLAEMVGYKTHSGVAKIEQGKTLPTLSKALHLARVLHVPVEAFVSESVIRPFDEVCQEAVATKPLCRDGVVRALREMADNIERLPAHIFLLVQP